MGDRQMNERYKVVLSNKNIYKEIEITSERKSLTVGTAMDSEVRLRKELFFGEIQLSARIQGRADVHWSQVRNIR